MKIRIQLVTGEILRTEGWGVTDKDDYQIFQNRDGKQIIVFSAPRHQIIYVATEDVVVEPRK